MDRGPGRGLFVDKKALYVRHEQPPIYQIFNAKADRVPGERATKRSQKIYQKNYGRIR